MYILNVCLFEQYRDKERKMGKDEGGEGEIISLK